MGFFIQLDMDKEPIDRIRSLEAEVTEAKKNADMAQKKALEQKAQKKALEQKAQTEAIEQAKTNEQKEKKIIELEAKIELMNESTNSTRTSSQSTLLMKLLPVGCFSGLESQD